MDSGERFVDLMNSAPAHAPLDYHWALLSAAIEPDRDVGQLLTMLDQLAEVVRADGVELSFDGVVSGLFGSGRLVGDIDNYHDVANSLLHSVLERGRGMPITLSIVAIEVGRRLGVPILGIGMPAHFVIRDAATERYADPFGSGITYSRTGIVEQWRRRTQGDRLPDAALAPNTTAQVMLRVLNNLSMSLTSSADRADPRLFRLAAIGLRISDFATDPARWRIAMRHWN